MATNRHIRPTSTLSPESTIQGNPLELELAAMQDIAVVLGRLDEPTCARVLHWVRQRFDGAAPVVTPPAPAAPLYVVPGPRPGPRVTAEQDADESLSVSTLGEFFDRRKPRASKPPATDPGKQSVTGMLHDFVAEFQDVVREWNVACDGPADGRTVEAARSMAC